MRATPALSRSGFLDVYDLCGWKIKTYGVANAPRAGRVTAARRVAAGTLPERPDLVGAFGLGFLIVRDAAGGGLARIHWWVRPDELHQRVLVAGPGEPWSLAPLATAMVGHLPELAIIEHERQAWLRHVLDSPTGPDFAAYLADVRR